MNDSDTKNRPLRYGLNCLWPSEIADQFYCEYKVHLKRTHPEVRLELPALELGEASHAALTAELQPVTAEEIERSIRAGKKLANCEWVLEARIQGVDVRGIPDFLAFEGKKALLLLDFKFSNARQPYPSQVVQTEVYALLTEARGFFTEELCLGIVIFPPTGFFGRDAAVAKSEELLRLNEAGTLPEIYELCDRERADLLKSRGSRRTIEGDGWKAFLYRYDRKRAEEAVAWALQFWRGEREPVPESQRPRKCFACPFNAARLCQHALQEPDPGFVVKRCPDGLVFVYR
jgi:hypothetical protein